MSEHCVVLVTCPPGEAPALAENLVEERLAACVNVVPSVRSVYRWEGKLAREEEALLVIKTRRDRFEALRARVVALHGYAVPEVIALPVEAGFGPYLEWVTRETSP
jgi:periplasmic divalent cation tolerance protein